MTDSPTAVITGGAKRIGAETAKTLHTRGYNVVIHCNTSAQQAQQLAERLNQYRANSAAVIQCPLGSQASADSLAEQALTRFGSCDLLINNASTFYATPLSDIREEQWDDLFASNAKAPLFLSRALHPSLKEKQGCIINIADIHAQRPLKNHTIYCMAKAANIMLTQSLALEMAPDVRVNGIAPGAMLWPDTAMQDEQRQQIKSRIPLGSLGGAAPIVDAILYLSNPNNYVTGQVLAVDGGKSLV